MFCYICEFFVVDEQKEAFEAEYGPGGAWVRLFARDPGYRRTELHRDVDDPNRFITIDYWTSREACMSFRQRFRSEFDAIDAACRAYIEAENYFGDFEQVSSSPR